MTRLEYGQQGVFEKSLGYLEVGTLFWDCEFKVGRLEEAWLKLDTDLPNGKVHVTNLGGETQERDSFQDVYTSVRNIAIT